jgi:pilus assembly protein CpaB
MNRRNRTLIVLLIAVAIAGAASYTVFRMIQRIPVREVEVATVHVAVAAQDLPMGTMVTKDHLRIVGWPRANQVEGSFSSAEAIVGRGVIQPISANEPLTESKLAPVEAGAGLSPSIPPGMRALSVKVNEVIGVAGFTVPGTRVDVLVTVPHRDDTITRVVVSNVQVLTAGTRYDQQAAREGQAISSTVVTLMVTPEDAEKITLAQNAGRINLVLRNPLDVLPTDTKGVRMGALTGAPAPPPVVKPGGGGVRPRVAPAPSPAPSVALNVVETFKAGKKSEEVIK